MINLKRKWKSGLDLNLKKQSRILSLSEKIIMAGIKNAEGKWYYTVFIENGRILDDEKIALKNGLVEVAKTGKANFRVYRQSKYDRQRCCR